MESTGVTTYFGERGSDCFHRLSSEGGMHARTWEQGGESVSIGGKCVIPPRPSWQGKRHSISEIGWWCWNAVECRKCSVSHVRFLANLASPIPAFASWRFTVKNCTFAASDAAGKNWRTNTRATKFRNFIVISRVAAHRCHNARNSRPFWLADRFHHFRKKCEREPSKNRRRGPWSDGRMPPLLEGNCRRKAKCRIHDR